jgi:hypothetical protein
MAKVYYCTPCIYETKDCSNYKRHIISKKHKERVKKYENEKINININKSKKINKINKKNNQCIYCKKEFSRSDSLNRHAERCLLKEFQKKDNIIEQKENQLQLKNEQIEYYRELLEMRGIKDSNVSKFTYISTKYPNVEPVEKLSYGVFKEYHKIRYINNSNKSFNELLVDDILHCFRKDTFPDYVARTISKIFKCKDKSMQKLWVTDPSRLKFMIKTIDDNQNNIEYFVKHNNDNDNYSDSCYNDDGDDSYIGDGDGDGDDGDGDGDNDGYSGDDSCNNKNSENKSFWKIDCGGFVVIDQIIKPILLNMKTLIEEYMNKHCFNKNISYTYKNECSETIDKIEHLMELKDNIVCGKYDKKILQRLVPNFIVKNKIITS